MHVPELIFGHLLTSSNYDDDMNKVTGGRNGYGAKLANIFSKHFSVECLDSKRKRKFFMEWENNMTKRHEPVIKSTAVKNDFTQVSFTPDLKRFNMTAFDKDIIALFTKRVYDIAGCNPKLKVYLNEQLIKISSFEKYVELYFEKKEVPHVFQQINDRWSVCVALSSSGQFQQVSFVNSICTTKGGTHVKYVTDKLTKDLMPYINKKNKGGAEIKGHQIKNYLWVFVNSLIVNPAFDSQTKETLTSQSSKFGSKCELPAEFVKKSKCLLVSFQRLVMVHLY
jgi:DNA topoisomerase-2